MTFSLVNNVNDQALKKSAPLRQTILHMKHKVKYCYQISEIKCKTKHTVGTVSKFNRKIVKRETEPFP
jgi:hypothetical protein